MKQNLNNLEEKLYEQYSLLQEEYDSNDVLLSFIGNIHQDTIASSVIKLESLVKDKADVKLAKKASTALLEVLQNIMYHSFKVNDQSYGFFITTMNVEAIKIKASNFIEETYAKSFTDNLDALIKKTPEERQKIYYDKIKNNPGKTRSAELGLITILELCDEATYELNDIGNQKVLFTLTLLIQKNG